MDEFRLSLKQYLKNDTKEIVNVESTQIMKHISENSDRTGKLRKENVTLKDEVDRQARIIDKTARRNNLVIVGL